MLNLNLIEKKFWSRVKKSRGCWVWLGYCTKFGHGMMQARKVTQAPMLTHRISWELTFGEIPRGLHVLHECDNPSCVRPSHLFLGTQADNNRDRTSKGRTASGAKNGARTQPSKNPFVRDGGSGLRGEKHPMMKLTDKQVQRLRRDYKRGMTKAEIARKYKISNTHAMRLVERRCR